MAEIKTISSIEAQSRDKTRVNVYLDGEFFRGMPAIVVLEKRLKAGEKIDVIALDNLILDADKEQFLTKAAAYATKSLKTVFEVKEYLRRHNCSDFVAAHCIAKLTEYGYLDDTAYVKAYVNTFVGSKGKMQLRLALRQKGVKQELIDEGLEQIDSAESDGTCLRLAQKYMKNKPANRETQGKLARFLYGKGFAWEQATRAIDTVFDKDGASDGDGEDGV